MPLTRLHLLAAVLGALAASAGARAAEEGKPLAVTIFYSREDPSWPDAEKIIRDSMRPFAARLAVESVCYDDAAGYARLARIEKELPVEVPGELTVLVGNFALTSKGRARRDVENYLAPVLARMLGGVELKTRRAAAVAGYAREVFGLPDAAIEKEREKLGAIYFRVSGHGRFLGWIVDAYRTIVCPVCYDAQFLVALSAPPELKVLGVRPVRELELYGRLLPAEPAGAFLRQFEGSRPGALRRVDAIVGATKTSHAYERSVAEILQELHSGGAAEKPPPTAAPGGGGGKP